VGDVVVISPVLNHCGSTAPVVRLNICSGRPSGPRGEKTHSKEAS
jgi:hypothetical protein